MWMRQKGIRFAPIYGRQAFKIEGRFKFWGGLTVEAWGGGPGLLAAWVKAATQNNIKIYYNAKAVELLHEDEGVYGVKLRQNGKTTNLKSKAVVLASGGFQANAEWRARYLGLGWDTAKVRGTRFNTGDGIKMA